MIVALLLSCASAAHAETVDAPDAIEQDACYLEGSYDVRLQGDSNNGWLMGSIGSEQIMLSVFGGRVSGILNGRVVNLTVENAQGTSVLSGWLGTYYVSWFGFNGWWSGYLPCVP